MTPALGKKRPFCPCIVTKKKKNILSNLHKNPTHLPVVQLELAGVCGVAVAVMVLVCRTPDGSFYPFF